jgi:hypothetical protein
MTEHRASRRSDRDDSVLRSRDDRSADEHRADVSAGAGNHATEQLLNRLRDGEHEGVPLPPDVRARMHERLGHDLGDVRVHTGPAAAQAAASVDAEAFTTGDDIVLGNAAAAPGTPAGDALLAHEAAHVVQQRAAGSIVPGVSAPGDATERAADALAHGTARSLTSEGAVPAVQRQPVIGKEQRPIKREEVETILRDYLEQVLYQQGRQTLDKTPQVIEAISSLFRNDPVMQASVEVWLKGITAGSPEGLAREVARKLPAGIPENALAKIRGKPKKPTPDTQPKTVADAAGATIVDSTVAPIVRGLGLSKDKQDKIISAARGAVGDGIIAVLDQALDAMGVAGQPKSAIHSAVEGAIKQKPGKAMDRQQEGAGSPYRKELPPTVAPPPPKAPGEHLLPLWSGTWDFPGTKPPPKPPAPLPKIDSAVEAAAAAVDPNVMIPAEVRGTARADEFGATGREFALDVAAKLDAAQAKKDVQVNIALGAQYATIHERADLMTALKAVVFRMRDALPHQASLVGRVNFTINGRIAHSFSLHPGPE